MAFRTNSFQQLSFIDSFSGLTSREQKALEHSRAKTFAEDISHPLMKSLLQFCILPMRQGSIHQ